MVMDVHLHAGCILMTYNAASPVKLVPLSDPLMGKLSTTKKGSKCQIFLSLVLLHDTPTPILVGFIVAAINFL